MLAGSRAAVRASSLTTALSSLRVTGARDGRSVEVVGTYNPRTNPASVELKRDRIDYWRSKGAQSGICVKKLVDKAAAAASPSEPTARA